ncbi:MAG TPA: hypothetical protein VGR13_04175 [Actinomycetota bacterium]|jgi:hypothetical protein|nr:hypothetical protein [Actinomycetota bacterium]
MYFEVRVFDTRADMMAHLRRTANFRRKVSWNTDDEDRIMAMVLPWREVVTTKSGRVKRVKPRIGVILLNREDLHGSVVAHEVAHAAMSFYRATRAHLRGRADFGTNCGPREERFAYIYGALFRRMNDALYDRKLWR